MASAKRAKWVEGITKSNRILRDLSEVLTSAIKDEDGISKTENWELVFPRPYNEYAVARGTTLQDPTQTRHYTPVIDKDELIELYDNIAVVIQDTEVVESTLVVKSEDLSITYVRDTDYTYDEETRAIKRIDTGSIPQSARLRVYYGRKVNKILDEVTVKVEKVLTIANPDRLIDPIEYTIDHSTGRVTFTAAPPTDAEYFALTFTDITGPYTTVEQDKLRLEPDPLDPTGQIFMLPASAVEIGQYPVHTKLVASAVFGVTGTAPVGSAITYQVDPTNHTVTFTSGEPVLDANQSLWINISEFTNPPVNTTYKTDRYRLLKDESESAPAGTYKILGVTNLLQIGVPHSIDVDTNTTEIQLYKHLSSLHAGYEELPETAYTIDYENPKLIVFMDIAEELRMTFLARDAEDLDAGLEKITNRVVLKTTTQPEQLFEAGIDNQFGADDRSEALTMYVELLKPNKLVNPETGLTRYVNWKGVLVETSDNNHYFNTRMFDKWDEERQQPAESIVDHSGKIIEKGAHISDWAKFSWLRDWKEFMIDELDDDAGSANVSDGIILNEIQINGVTDEFPIQFWVSTNNNRAAIVLMGDPTLDADNFLTSFGYLGRIHPFYDKECVVKRDESGTILLDEFGDPLIEEKRTYFQNDVSGNFALTVGSSTIPVSVSAPPGGTAIVSSTEVAKEADDSLVNGTLYDNTAYAYLVTYLTDSGESRPTPLNAAQVIAPSGIVDSSLTAPTSGMSIKIRFNVPEEATGYRIYRFHQSGVSALPTTATTYTNYKLVTSVTKLDKKTNIEYTDTGSSLPMYQEVYNPVADAFDNILVPSSTNAFFSKVTPAATTSRAFEAVTRDVYTGAILDVKFSSKWGKDTGNGVADIMMYTTRSGLKFQRHLPSFITTEEFVNKEHSGQSRWTGKFHMSPVYVEHSYDKQRGWLDGVMAVDHNGVEHLDDLIINKDTSSEEVYKYFRINAPYSMFNNSANYAYGVAIIKSSLLW